MRREQGMTLIELVVVLAAGSILLLATAAYALPMLAREAMRSAIYDVQTHMQLARIEAVSRNRDCRFLVDTAQRRVRVLDSMGTATLVDDEVLFEARLPATISFARPDTGSAVTLTSLGSGVFHTVFASDGTVRVGPGIVSLFGGDQYRRVSLFVAGGIQVERWNGTAWAVGS